MTDPHDTEPSEADPPTTRAARVALVALLRHPDTRWADVVQCVHEAGSAAALLDSRVGQRGTLLPDEGSAGRLTIAAATEIRNWESEGIGVHAFLDDSYPRQLHEIKETPR